MVLWLRGGSKMPRHMRVKSKMGVYHIIMRGINRQSIFEEPSPVFVFHAFPCVSTGEV